MIRKYILFLLPLLILVVAAQSATNIYYTGYWRLDPGIRLYNICCPGSVQLPGNDIRIYSPQSGDILSYISLTGLNFSMDSGMRIKGAVNFTPENPKVISANGIYRIYFTVSNTPNKGSAMERVYTANSPDGFKFNSITPISDPSNLSFNNGTGLISHPTVSAFQNGTIGFYYMYSSAAQPTASCGSLFEFATSTDGIHFTNHGCVNFVSGKSYNFIDPTWATLPNGDVMLIFATQSPSFTPLDVAQGLYVSYSTDRTWLNFTTPQLIISPPGPNKTTEIDLLQDPNVNYLINGSYRMYYDVYPTLKNSDYENFSSPVYIDSAVWVPTPNFTSNSSTIIQTTTPTVLSTSTTTILRPTTYSTTTVIENSQLTKGEVSLIELIIVVFIALAVVFYFLGRRMN